MAKLNFGKGLKEKLQSAADAAKSAARDAKSAVKDVKLPDVEGVKAKVKDIKLPDVEGVKAKVTGVRDSFGKMEKSGMATPEPDAISVISTRSALKIVYYLMAADGEILSSEEEKFDSIGRELDPFFADHKAELVQECRAQMEKALDLEDYYDVLQDGVEEALRSSLTSADSFITPKLLVWDLLTIAYSDNAYDETERRLVKYVVRKTSIDKAVFLEMESSIMTLMDIERELAWIKTTDKPYLTIEAMVNELVDRKNVVFESVKDLISL